MFDFELFFLAHEQIIAFSEGNPTWMAHGFIITTISIKRLLNRINFNIFVFNISI